MSEPAPLLAPLRPATIEPRLWRAGGFVADPWHSAADDAPLPASGDVLVSPARWRRDRAALSVDDIRVGIRLQPSDDLDPTADDLGRLALIALSFAKFSDGRAYSSAQRLRGRHGYRGELRATGDVLIDQIPLMLRTGFDTFEIVDTATIAALSRGDLPAVQYIYQSGHDLPAGAWRSRRAASG